MKLLSVIVPVFNKENYLDTCLQSILAQTFTDFELILVDDGSTDRSGLMCDHYKQLDSRIKVIHQENRGVSAARNAGLDISKGQYIGFIDSDDTIELNMYEILIKNALDSDSDISICSMKKTYKGKSTLVNEQTDIESFDKDQALSFLLKGHFNSSVNNKIFKCNIAKIIKFEGRFKEDALYNFLAFCQSNKVIFQNISLYNYILRNNSVSVEEFSEKDMEGLYVTQKILDIVSRELPFLLKDARVNDFVENLSKLNLIIRFKKSNYPEEYKMICNNLKRYSPFLKKNYIVKRKHRYAYCIFKMSPFVYSFLLKLYVLVIPSEISRRGKEPN